MTDCPTSRKVTLALQLQMQCWLSPPAHRTFCVVPQPGYPGERIYRWNSLLAKAGHQSTVPHFPGV